MMGLLVHGGCIMSCDDLQLKDAIVSFAGSDNIPATAVPLEVAQRLQPHGALGNFGDDDIGNNGDDGGQPSPAEVQGAGVVVNDGFGQVTLINSADQAISHVIPFAMWATIGELADTLATMLERVVVLAVDPEMRLRLDRNAFITIARMQHRDPWFYLAGSTPIMANRVVVVRPQDPGAGPGDDDDDDGGDVGRMAVSMR